MSFDTSRFLVAKWMSCSACNTESTFSSLHSGNFCVDTLSKSLRRSCSAPSMFCHIIVHALLNFARQEISNIIVLYCILATLVSAESRDWLLLRMPNWSWQKLILVGRCGDGKVFHLFPKWLESFQTEIYLSNKRSFALWPLHLGLIGKQKANTEQVLPPKHID